MLRQSAGRAVKLVDAGQKGSKSPISGKLLDISDSRFSSRSGTMPQPERKNPETPANEPVSSDRVPMTQVQWLEWAKNRLGVDFGGATQLVYRQNTAVALLTVQNHTFFKGIDEFLRDCNSEYIDLNGAELFMGEPHVKLDQKSYESAVNKSYRHNYVQNRRFPEKPRGGWYTPDNWFTELNDLIRGTLVCKYIDGPEFLAKRIKTYANSFGLTADYTSQQRDEGYYAFHCYIKIPVQLIDLKLQNLDVDLQVELQLTTQLQEILYNITHRFFEETRNQRVTDRVAWKWDVTSNRFKAGYLSHTLHLLEAIVLELRNFDAGIGQIEILNEPPSEEPELSSDNNTQGESTAAPNSNRTERPIIETAAIDHGPFEETNNESQE